MTLSQSHNLCSRLSAVGLRQEVVHQLVDTVDRWKQSSGTEWTVSRLKSLKVDYVRQMAGLQPVAEWVSRKPDGTPSGPFGRLWHPSVKTAKALAALAIYTEFSATQPTLAQKRKFLTSLFASTMTEGAVEREVSALKRAVGPRLKTPRSPLQVEPLVLSRVSPKKRCPNGVGKSFPEMDRVECAASLMRTQLGTRLLTEFPDPVLRALGIDLMPLALGFSEPAVKGTPEYGVVGRISGIQEVGFKLRVVANPNRLVQSMLEPLKDSLFTAVRSCPWDCTFDQEAGVKWVQSQLQLGKTLFCYDLSDATNYFPLDYQEEAIRVKVPGSDSLDEQLRLFRFCSRGPWLLPKNLSDSGRDRVVSWTQGQPLGLGPSFAAFGLSHGLLLYSHLPQFSGKRVDYPFRVLGDDVVIADPHLAEDYKQSLRGLGVPFSTSKTIVSGVVAEFAGRVITQSEVFLPPKWRKVSDRSFVDVVRPLGPQAKSLLRPRQKKVFEIISSWPEPWGLGWNPKGIPLQVRMEQVISSLGDPPLTKVVSPRKLVRLTMGRHFGEPRGIEPDFSPTRLRQLLSVLTHLDQRCALRHVSSLGSLLSGVGLDTVLAYDESDILKEAINQGFRQMSLSSDARGLSTLEILERKLDISPSLHPKPISSRPSPGEDLEL